MISLWIISAVIFIFQIPKTQGEVTTNTSNACATNTQCQDFVGADYSVCRDGFCYCYKHGEFYIWSGNSCTTVMEPEDILEIKQGEHVDVIDLLQMKGLHCGNRSAEYFSYAQLDEIPVSCFHGVIVEFGRFEVNLENTIMETNNICEVNQVYSAGINNARCFTRTQGFQLVLTTDDSRFLAGVYSDTNGALNILTISQSLAFNLTNAAHVAENDNVENATSIKIKVNKYQHPDCESAFPKITMTKCPEDTRKPVVNIVVHFKGAKPDVILHDNVEIQCLFLSLTNITKVEWYFESREGVISVTVDDDTQIDTMLEENSSNLTLIDMTQDRIGKYICKVTNQNGNRNDTYDLKIKGELPKPYTSEKKKVVAIGYNATLTCTIPETYPSIIVSWWEKNNTMSRDNINSNILILDRVVPEDLDNYRCCANNTEGTNCSNEIELGALPYEVNISYDGEALIDTSFQIKCSARSFPHPEELFLLRNGKIVSQSHQTTPDSMTSPDTVIVDPQTGGRSFKFPVTNKVEITNEGNYSCQAMNRIGNRTSNVIYVEVYGIIFNQTTSIDVIYGETKILTCPIDFVNPHTYNVSWYFNDTCLNTMTFMNCLSTRNYQIKSAEFSDEGEYRCQVDNGKQSKRSDGFFLGVRGDYPSVASHIHYGNQEYSDFLSVNQSERVELICNITALPTAINVFWIKDQDGNTKTFSRTVLSPNLVFDTVELGDAGNYTCNATNPVGSRTGNTITLQVNETIPMCPCSCAFKEKLKYWKRRNITKEELLKEMQPFMKEVQNDIKMDKSKISAAIRKRTSAPDDRKSAEQIGTLGIVLIVGAFVMITLFDILTCVRFCSRRNRVANY